MHRLCCILSQQLGKVRQTDMDLQYVSAHWLRVLIDLSLSYKVRRNCEASRERFKQVPVHQFGRLEGTRPDWEG